MRLKSLKPEFRSYKDYVRGISSPLPYEVRNTTGDWSLYFGIYESQKYWLWDTDCCWAFSGIEVVEDQLEFLWKTNQFSEEAKAFFTSNGYVYPDGDFYLSRRFVPVLSGVRDNGNDQINFWKIAAKYGLIPNSSLPYTIVQAEAWRTKDMFDNDYFNPACITVEMKALGQKFLQYVGISYEWIEKEGTMPDTLDIRTILYNSPLQIGIPVPREVIFWNQVKVKWDGTRSADHAVELYRFDPEADPEYPYFVYDQYEPHLKQLSKDYFLPLVTHGLVSAIPAGVNPVKQGVWQKVWAAIRMYFANL